MTLQLLISTMNQKNYDILNQINLKSDAVVINQCELNNRKEIIFNGFDVLWINTSERGLSCSRNMAIKNATADICVLADDDEEFRSDYRELIERAFEENESYSIFRFRIHGIEKDFKKYPSQSYKIKYLMSLKLSSVELAFRRSDIIKNHILFNELIGAGTRFLMGEENAFLFQCLNKGLKILYIPQTIADLHLNNSTWFKGYNEQYFFGRGAAFTAINRHLSILLILQFVIRKIYLYRKNVGLIHSVKFMLDGRKEYLRVQKREKQ